jgi:hypothetical protein
MRDIGGEQPSVRRRGARKPQLLEASTLLQFAATDGTRSISVSPWGVREWRFFFSVYLQLSPVPAYIHLQGATQNSILHWELGLCTEAGEGESRIQESWDHPAIEEQQYHPGPAGVEQGCTQMLGCAGSQDCWMALHQVCSGSPVKSELLRMAVHMEFGVGGVGLRSKGTGRLSLMAGPRWSKVSKNLTGQVSRASCPGGTWASTAWFYPEDEWKPMPNSTHHPNTFLGVCVCEGNPGLFLEG